MTDVLRQVEATLLNCAQAVAAKRCASGATSFLDPYNIKKLGGKKQRCFFTTCEWLEIIFQTMLYLQKSKHFFTKHPKLASRIQSDFDFLFDSAQRREWKFFSGAPYLGTFGRKTHDPFNSVEALAYFVTVAAHVLKLDGIIPQRLSSHSKSEIVAGLEASLRTLVESHTGNGWPLIIGQKTPNVYATWSVLEALDELGYRRPSLYDAHVSEDITDRTARWLQDQLKNGVRQEAKKLLDKLPTEEEYKQSGVLRRTACLYYLVQAATGLVLLGRGNQIYLGSIVADLLNQKTYFISEDFPTQYPHELEDYTLIPLLLRCLSAAFLTNQRDSPADNRFLRGVGQLAAHRDLALYDLFWKLVSEKRALDNTGAYTGLFCEPDPDKPGEQRMWELFYSQRAQEALICYREYLIARGAGRRSLEVKRIPTSKRRKKVGKRTSSRSRRRTESRTPERVIEAQSSLPALRAYTEMLRGQYGTALTRCVVVGVQHFLWDLPAFVAALTRLGAAPRDIYLLRKTYGYPDGDDVENALKSMGCRTLLQPPVPSSAKRKRREFLGRAIGRARRAQKKIVIVEDGGHFVPLAHDESRANIRLFLGAVEQTTRGLLNDQLLGDRIAFPIVNVARSKLKSEEEGPAVAETLAGNIYDVCVSSQVNFRPRATKVLVVGYGTVGANVAEKLRAREFKVAVCDRDRKRREEAAKSGFEVVASPAECGGAKVVLGLSGKRTIDIECIVSLPHNAIIASGSSEYYEIDLDALEGATEPPKSRNIRRDKHTRLTTYRLSKDKAVRLLCDGEPINFSLSGGIPDVAIQPVLMQLLWGATALAVRAVEPGKRNRIVRFPAGVENEIRRMRDKME